MDRIELRRRIFNGTLVFVLSWLAGFLLLLLLGNSLVDDPRASSGRAASMASYVALLQWIWLGITLIFGVLWGAKCRLDPRPDLYERAEKKKQARATAQARQSAHRTTTGPVPPPQPERPSSPEPPAASNPDQKDLRLKGAELLSRTGDEAMARGDFETARYLFKECLAREPESNEYRDKLFRAAQAWDEVRRAQAEREKAARRQRAQEPKEPPAVEPPPPVSSPPQTPVPWPSPAEEKKDPLEEEKCAICGATREEAEYLVECDFCDRTVCDRCVYHDAPDHHWTTCHSCGDRW